MKTFMKFLESESDFLRKSKEAEKNSAYTEGRLNVVRNIAIEYGKPEPTTFLDSGSSATIFNTTDPNVVARVAQSGECEKVMHEPQFQESGGVVKIFLYVEKDGYKVSFKERVNILYEHEIRKEYKEDGLKIIGLLDNIYYPPDGIDETIKFLKKFPMTRNLANAIEMGLPTRDISNDNLGMTMGEDKRIVVIDC
jgi:hypothetical protein